MATLETIEALLKEFKNSNETQHNEIIKRQDKTNGSVGKNTSFRNRVMGGMAVIGFLGIGSLISVALLWVKVIRL